MATSRYLQVLKSFGPRNMVAGILKHRVVVLILVAAISGLFAAYLPRLTIW